MSRDIRGKIAREETLNEDDLRYAVEALGMGAELVAAGYDVPASGTMVDAGNFGTPTGNVLETGPAFEQPGQASGPVVVLDADKLNSLKADTLDEIAEAVGVEVPRKKADKVAVLTGGAATGGDDEDGDE